MNINNEADYSQSSKAGNLRWLEEEIAYVPAFIVIDPSLLIKEYGGLQQRIDICLQQTERNEKFSRDGSAQIASIIETAEVDNFAAERALRQALEIEAEEYIFRTSAHLEDKPDLSFAGIYSSFGPLCRAEIDVEKLVKQCWRSLYSERAISYLLTNQIALKSQNFVVIAQSYYRGLFSGVAFVDPHRSQATLAFNAGGAESVVGGAASSSFTADFNLKTPVMPNQIAAQVLTQNWKKFLAALQIIARQKGVAQDVEWAIGTNDFAIFQTRDVTAEIVNSPSETVWDSTNIAESYPGVTLPLTYSFIRHAYSQVYVHFLRSIGISEKLIKQHDALFPNLLGHLRGRVHYNVTNWYEMVKLLPGYKYNKEFFEEMWNPKRKLESSGASRTSWFSKLSLVPLLARFVWKLLTTDLLVKKFLREFEEKHQRLADVSIAEMSPSRLAQHYRTIENDFFSAWQVPILNDFRVMIFHGIFKKLAKSIVASEDENFISLLLTNHLELSTLQPIYQLQDVKNLIQQNQAALDLFSSDLPSVEVLRIIAQPKNNAFADIYRQIQKYIADYGDRNPSELKLESPTVKENPELVIELIRNYLSVEDDPAPSQKSQKQHQLQQITAKLKDGVKRKYGFLSQIYWTVLQFTLGAAKKAIATRENLRFKRSIAFGLARRIFLQMGRLLAQERQLEQAADIFYLTREEVLSLAEGHSFFQSLSPVIIDRKEIFDDYKNAPSPSRRFKTRSFSAFSPLIADGADKNIASQNVFAGIPASAGIVRSEVLCLKEFDLSCDYKSKILVTLQTDPGWTTIFPLISGLITERGNILSHAAIVSRELGIPSVLAVEGITDVLKTGDVVEINGSLGTITLESKLS